MGLLQGSDNNYITVDSVTEGTRNNTLTEVLLQSLFSTATDLLVKVEYGPANANPVFYFVQIFNYATGLFETLAFGILSTRLDIVVEANEIPSPNDHLSDVGEILIRVAGTAREVQTPGAAEKRRPIKGRAPMRPNDAWLMNTPSFLSACPRGLFT